MINTDDLRHADVPGVVLCCGKHTLSHQPSVVLCQVRPATQSRDSLHITIHLCHNTCASLAMSRMRAMVKPAQWTRRPCPAVGFGDRPGKGLMSMYERSQQGVTYNLHHYPFIVSLRVCSLNSSSCSATASAHSCCLCTHAEPCPAIPRSDR